MPATTKLWMQRRSFIANVTQIAAIERLCYNTNGRREASKDCYACRDEFVLGEGMFWTTDWERSTQVLESYGFAHLIKKRCFANSQQVMEEVGLSKGWSYVEGLACSTFGLPLHHAWLVDEEGLVLDPTWDEGDFYLGVPFQWRMVQNLITEENCTMLDRWEGGQHPMLGEPDKRVPRENFLEKRWAPVIAEFQQLSPIWDGSQQIERTSQWAQISQKEK